VIGVLPDLDVSRKECGLDLGGRTAAKATQTGRWCRPSSTGVPSPGPPRPLPRYSPPTCWRDTLAAELIIKGSAPTTQQPSRPRQAPLTSGKATSATWSLGNRRRRV